MDEQKQLTTIYNQYSKIKDYLTSKGYYEQLKKNYNFFMGDQWKDLESGNTPMPIDNIIAPICGYKIGIVSQNNMTILYSSENIAEEDLEESKYTDETGQTETTSNRKIYDKTVKLLSENANRFFEVNNLESDMWDYNEENCISGIANMYIYKDKEGIERAEMVHGNNIFFADENEENIQNQEFVLITFRRPVEQIRQEAIANGMSEEDAKKIVADTDTTEQIGNDKETEIGEGKALCILKLYKKTKKYEKQTTIGENGNSEETDVEVGTETKTTVHMVKSTKNVVYVKETNLELTLYPIAKMIWKREKNSARGRGEPQDKITNQIEINKTLARRDIAIQLTAYPKLAYLREAITNPGSLDKVGVAISIGGKQVQDIRNAIDYLRPAQLSPDAKQFNDELAQKTRENAAAGDTALGNINPEKASGRSIIAVRDASAIPLNVHVNRFKRFFEDIARILFDFWQNTDVEGKTISFDELNEETGQTITRVETIPYEIMQKLKVSVKVNVAQVDPYSIYAVEQMWDNLFIQQKIDFEEWVNGLNKHSKYDKSKLEEIIRKRKEREKELAQIEQEIKEKQAMIHNVNGQAIEDISSNVESQQQEITQMLGGANNELSPM